MTTPTSATLPVVERDEYERELAQQIEIEKELTRFGDRVSARRRRLPMTPIDDYVFAGNGGPMTLSDLFGEHPQLVLQSFMFHPDWDDGRPSYTWAANNMPNDLDDLLEPKGVAFAMVARAPLGKLQAWSDKQGWGHLTWVSSADNSFNTDWGWTVDGQDQPGYSYLPRTDDGIFLTYRTDRRGTEALHPTLAIRDRTIYVCQQDFEDIPDGRPKSPPRAEPPNRSNRDADGRREPDESPTSGRAPVDLWWSRLAPRSRHLDGVPSAMVRLHDKLDGGPRAEGLSPAGPGLGSHGFSWAP